ncbi:anti-sigma factor [Pseudonocardia humida]|uniref:Regulator of SigK n=1 Tax=Pseudonocardia humida TaxID=2800819 RepID=A0ABT1ABZ8_9PSEU|nr:anti-sigma factor [Pseudonocardia humida]MCO1660518.1 anti-sigma factor [Pseudonocardia humida]
MSRPTDDDCPMNEQAVGFVLHALEPAEEIQVLRHLPGCASCRAVVGDAEGVFTRMGGAVEQVDPPPSLRATLMARAAQTPQVQGRPRPPQPPVPPSEPLADPTPDAAPDVPAAAPDAEPNTTTRPSETPRRPRENPSTRPGPSGPPSRRSWLSRRGRRLVAAAVALIGVLAIGGLAVRTAQLQEQRDAELAQSRSLSGLLEQLGRPGTKYALLAEEGGATVAAVVVTDGERQVYPLALPANATERDIYVLWGLGTSGTPEPLGTFDVLPADPGLRAVGTGAATDTYAQYAVSIEPGRTAPATPTKVVAIGEVTA